jgi:hypothetical protein
MCINENHREPGQRTLEEQFLEFGMEVTHRKKPSEEQFAKQVPVCLWLLREKCSHLLLGSFHFVRVIGWVES